MTSNAMISEDLPIVVNDICKSYGSVSAVSHLSCTVKRGKCLGLIGHNGAGKTTSLCIVAGLTLPTSGSVRVLGQNISSRPRGTLQRMNFVSAYMDMPSGLKVHEIIILFARLYGRRESRSSILDELLGRFDIEGIANRYMNTLSAGQRARVLLAKGFVNRPDILLLDEPTASLDPLNAGYIRSIIKSQKSGGTTIVLSSHNMKDVAELCDDVLFFHEGRVVAAGSPDSLRRDYDSDDLDDVYVSLATAPANDDALAASAIDK